MKEALSSFGKGDVDITVALNTIPTEHDIIQCFVRPVNALQSSNDRVPTLVRTLEFNKRGITGYRPVTYPRTVAFSLQMGVAQYMMETATDGEVKNTLHKKCYRFNLLDYSQVCQATAASVTEENTTIDITPGPPTTLRSYDTLELLKAKATLIMGHEDIPANFTWFMWNVHLTDTTSKCLTGGPFYRLKKFRSHYKREYHKIKLQQA
ncbi:uncharacterized protein LOC144161994 [Haemaphysalis longicornis]